MRTAIFSPAPTRSLWEWSGLSLDEQWRQLGAGQNGLSTGNGINALLATSGGAIFAGSYGDGVFRSTDNGDNWTPVNTGLTERPCHFLHRQSERRHLYGNVPWRRSLSIKR